MRVLAEQLPKGFEEVKLQIVCESVQEFEAIYAVFNDVKVKTFFKSYSVDVNEIVKELKKFGGYNNRVRNELVLLTSKGEE